MAKVQINKYGWPLIKQMDTDLAVHWYHDFYMIDSKTANTTYKCFSNAPQRIIWRETVSNSVTTLEFAYGPWANRASLTYAPINGSLEVDV